MTDGVCRAEGAFDQQDTNSLRLAFVQGVMVLKRTHRVDADVERKFAKALIRTLCFTGFDRYSTAIDVDQLVALSVARVIKAAGASQRAYRP